jgi:calpain-15
VTRNNRPAFSSTKDEELWVILLEKAWAKLHKTYARTEGGLPSFATIHLLGTPAESHFHEDMQKDVEKFW